MESARPIHQDQKALWNGPGGRAWIDTQELLDQVLQPLEDLLVEAAWERHATDVLDVGCGTGTTTLAVARQLGARCAGIDISEPMIARARARAERDRSSARFLAGDAQSFAFEPASFDMLISRFGIMFFDDPVGAFANLRRAASQDAELRVIAWRSAGENPFMTTAERLAAPLLSDLPPRQPDAPGQFAFADQGKVRRMLEDSGWVGIDIAPIDVPCTFPESELDRYLTQLGPVGLALQDADEQTRERVLEAVRPAFSPYVHGDEVRFTASCWMVGAETRSR